MPGSALAVFAVKAPVEPTAPTQDQMNDSGFKDFIDTAVHKVDAAQKPSKDDSPQNQNDTQAKKTQPKAKTRTEDNSQEVSAPKENKPQSTPETEIKDSSVENTVTKDSLIEDTKILAAQLQELGINQAQFESLLDLLGLNGDADLDTLLQSLTQALNLNQNSSGDGTNPSELIARIQQNQVDNLHLLIAIV